jgi:hypothetical protein
MDGRQQIAWARDERFEETWKRRIRRMAAHLGESKSVIDYGSGPEWLREFLPPSVEYFPCDYSGEAHRRSSVTSMTGNSRASLRMPALYQVSGIRRAARMVHRAGVNAFGTRRCRIALPTRYPTFPIGAD